MRSVLAVLTVNPDYMEFGVPELKSLLRRLGLPLSSIAHELAHPDLKHYQINHHTLRRFPFVTIHVPDFAASKEALSTACRTSVAVNKLILLISEGRNYLEMLEHSNQSVLEEECRNQQELIMCEFQSRNRHFDRPLQIAKIDQVFGKLMVRGVIDLKQSTKRYQLIEDHQWYQNHHKTDQNATLMSVYFGLELCNNKIGTAKFNTDFELPKRIYLGPTSMNNDLAFLMAHQGQIQKGSLVYDPFVGTGGLLIPTAFYGAINFGSDLDIRVINGYSVGRINTRSPYYSKEKHFEVYTPKINLNFEQYVLESPNIIRADSTKPMFREGQLFDAIITDPPYGIRAMSRSTGQKSKKQKEQLNQTEGATRQAKQERNQMQKDLKKQSQEKELSSEIYEATQAKDLTQTVGFEKVQPIAEKQEDSSLSEDQQRVGCPGLTPEQLKWKKERRRRQKENRRKRKEQLPEDVKKFKRDIVLRLNDERVLQWDRFDKGKIETAEREEIFRGLLQLGRRHVKIGGRLVFLYPIYEEQEFRGIKSLPAHEGFAVIDMSENELSGQFSRVLVTLQKL